MQGTMMEVPLLVPSMLDRAERYAPDVEIVSRLPFGKVIFVRHSSAELPAGVLDYEEVVASADGNYQAPDLSETDPCGLCYTSATTGKNKGVVYTHRSTVLHTMMVPFADGIA